MQKNTAKQNTSDPHVRAWACGIVVNDILINARVSSKARLNDKINTWPCVYTPLYIDISHVVFVCFMSYFLCAHSAIDFSPCA